ncbi:MAG: nucleoside deaminase [Alphaproteobacteria bacterium]|nr:nucleoside deaminase [Alphaproteobacteria bacterium]
MDKTEWMRRTIEICRQRLADGSGAYCASIVVKNDKIVGEGVNNVVMANDPTGHCEINAIRDAGNRLKSHDLSGCTLYTTWEPCIMCAAAIWWARIDRVYYANLLTDAKRIGMDIAPLVAEVTLPSGQRPRPYERLLGDEAWAVLDAWWKRAKPDGL